LFCPAVKEGQVEEADNAGTWLEVFDDQSLCVFSGVPS